VTSERRKAEAKARRAYLQEGREDKPQRPEGYVADRKRIEAKAYLVGLWVKEGLERLNALKGEERRRAVKAFRRAESLLSPEVSATPAQALACIKAGLLAACAEPAEVSDLQNEVATICTAVEVLGRDWKDLIGLLAGNKGRGGKTVHGDDLSSSNKRGSSYNRACSAVNKLAGKPAEFCRKGAVIRHLVQDTVFGNALRTLVLHALHLQEAKDLFEDCLSRQDVPLEATCDACAEYMALRMGLKQVVTATKEVSASLYDECFEEATSLRVEEKEVAQKESGVAESYTYKVSVDGGKTWKNKTLRIKGETRDRIRRKKAGIRQVSLEVLQHRDWTREAQRQAEELGYGF
jgi:hypothetical protein